MKGYFRRNQVFPEGVDLPTDHCLIGAACKAIDRANGTTEEKPRLRTPPSPPPCENVAGGMI